MHLIELIASILVFGMCSSSLNAAYGRFLEECRLCREMERKVERNIFIAKSFEKKSQESNVLEDFEEWKNLCRGLGAEKLHLEKSFSTKGDFFKCSWITEKEEKVCYGKTCADKKVGL